MKSCMAERNGYRWTVKEVLSLQREFELLEWDIDAIAHKHKRTPEAIMFRLDQEGFADYNVLYKQYHEKRDKEEYRDENKDEMVETEEEGGEGETEEEISHMDVIERIDELEKRMEEMKLMMEQMMLSFQDVK